MKKVTVQLTAKTMRELEALSKEEGHTPAAFLKECLTHNIASRRDAGWNMRNGWAEREKIEAQRMKLVAN